MLEEDGGEGEEGQQLETKEIEADGGEEKEFDLEEDEGRKKGKSHATVLIREVYSMETHLWDIILQFGLNISQFSLFFPLEI